VDLKRYGTYKDARANIGALIKEMYNVRGLHSALGYLPPGDFPDCPTLAVHVRLCRA